MASIPHLILSMITQSNNKDIQCHTLHDLYVVAKKFWNQRDYTSSYRLFYHLEKTHQYQITNCCWYRVQCLIQLGLHIQAVELCLSLSKSYPTDSQWYLIASEIYLNRQNYFLAHEILSKASNLVSNFNGDYSQIQFQKRIAYEAQQHHQDKHQLMDIILGSNLSYDVLFCIFDQLDLKSLVRCTAVSRGWKNFLTESCPHLWDKLEFENNKARYIGSSTIKSLLGRLGKVSLKKLSIRYQQADGDGVLLTLAKQPNYCRHLNTLVLFNVLVTPVVFFNALEHVGTQLQTLEWGGVSIWLNDLMENVPKVCARLRHLVVYDCFTSLYNKDQFFVPLKLNYLKSLKLSNIHGLKTSYLAHILSQCSNLKHLSLRKSNIDVTAIMGVFRTTPLPKLKCFDFEKNVFSQTDMQKMTTDTQKSTNKNTLKELTIQSDNTLENSDLQYMLDGAQGSLEVLDLRGSVLISDTGLLLNQQYSRLETLCLKECFEITSQGLLTLLSFSPLLKSIDLSYLSIVNDDVLEELSEKSQIRHIDMTHCKKTYTEKRIRSLVHKRRDSLQKIKLTHCSLNLLLFITTAIKSDIV